MRAAFALRSLRVAAPRAAPLARFAPSPRALHASARRLASEPESPLDDPRVVDLRSKIEAHEGARQAIIKLGQLMQAKGVDLSKPPSTTQVIKLGMDKEIREAGQNLMVQLKEAGVEINPETASQIFSKVVKDDKE